MEVRVFARQILESERIEDKLFDPFVLTDNEPGPPLLIKEPARSHSIMFCKTCGKKRQITPFSYPS